MLRRTDVEKVLYNSAYCEIEKMLDTHKDTFFTKEEIYMAMMKMVFPLSPLEVSPPHSPTSSSAVISSVSPSATLGTTAIRKTREGGNHPLLHNERKVKK